MVEKMYFIAAWVVAGSALLALILGAVAASKSAMLAMGAVFDGFFFGITGTFALLYFSGWFKKGVVLFILAWVVAGLALLSLIFTAAANVSGTYTVATIFSHIGLGVFCTLLLLYLSGKLSLGKKT